MKRIIYLILVLAVRIGVVFGQHQELNEPPKTYKLDDHEDGNKKSLLLAFKQGKFRGHFRYYFLATDNQKPLTDYFANAAGGGIHYESGSYKGFRMAISGFYIFNIGSSDLSKPDSITGQFNRYEIGLFDIEDAGNKKDINRLEEFFLQYQYHNLKLLYGRQLMNNPFINLQDGRMRPTVVEGLTMDWAFRQAGKITASWLYGISPRSTTRWFEMGSSIGVYPTGINPDGTKSGYKNQLDTKGAGLLGIRSKVGEHLNVQFWNLFVEGIFNSALGQLDYVQPLKSGTQFYAAGQLVRQDALEDGGHEDISKRYFDKGGKSITFGVRAGLKNKRWDGQLNYNRIGSQGRYLLPREWGRDPFFTFLPRERNEGFGDVHALMGRIQYQSAQKRWTGSLAAGYYDLPDVHDFKLNKYAMPGYVQANLDIRYKFSGLLDGLESQFLFVVKRKTGESYGDLKNVIHKVDMSLYHVILNYYF